MENIKKRKNNKNNKIQNWKVILKNYKILDEGIYCKRILLKNKIYSTKVV